MYEAADGALRALLRHCRSAALLPHLALPLVADRSIKLRGCCAAYLLQVRAPGANSHRLHLGL